MVRRVVIACSLVLGVAISTACGAGHYVQRGADLYGEGRYVEAAEVFERSEPRLGRAPIRERAAYAAYRGANFVALGDLRHADLWLTVASAIERKKPGTLSGDERSFLDGAWRALNRRMPVTPPAPATTVIASSSQPPSPSVEAIPATAPTEQRSLVPQ